MLRKLRRLSLRNSLRNHSFLARKKESGANRRDCLRLESLENRVLLDTAGLWDDIGWRSASGGGISYDGTVEAAETERVLSSDGDPVVFWVEGTLDEFVAEPVPFGFETTGSIYARQYAGDDMGWMDLGAGRGDANSVGFGSQLSAASGPDGRIVLAWVSSSNIYVSVWDGSTWIELDGSATDTGISDTRGIVIPEDQEEGEELIVSIQAEQPSIAFSHTGEIYVSYTAMHPNNDSNQRDIVVKKYGYDYSDNETGPPQASDLQWIELVHEDVGEFGLDENQQTGGASNDEGNSYNSSIAIDIDGKPIVVWTDVTFEGNAEIFAKRWDGDSWEEDWGGRSNTGSASDPETHCMIDRPVRNASS